MVVLKHRHGFTCVADAANGRMWLASFGSLDFSALERPLLSLKASLPNLSACPLYRGVWCAGHKEQAPVSTRKSSSIVP